MVGTTGGDEHWFAVVSLNDALTDYYRSDLRASTAQLSNRFTDGQWQAIKRGPA
jgi:hypothetical protein